MKEMPSRAPRNRTLILSEQDAERLRRRLLVVDRPILVSECAGRTILGDSLLVLPLLPKQSVDLLIVDPPYNLTKTFSDSTFKRQPVAEYEEWLHSWVSLVAPLLKSSASVYVCSEWRSSGAVQRVEEIYCLLAERRLELTNHDPTIQGYSGGCFWDRNTLALQEAEKAKPRAAIGQSQLFEEHS